MFRKKMSQKFSHSLTAMKKHLFPNWFIKLFIITQFGKQQFSASLIMFAPKKSKSSNLTSSQKFRLDFARKLQFDKAPNY